MITYFHWYVSVLHTCFYTFPVTDAAATAPPSSSQPSTTTQTDENPSSHVAGMYIKLSLLCTIDELVQPCYIPIIIIGLLQAKYYGLVVA